MSSMAHKIFPSHSSADAGWVRLTAANATSCGHLGFLFLQLYWRF